MNKKIYWKIRNFFKNAIFFVKKIFFKANRRAFEEKKHSNYFKYIIKIHKNARCLGVFVYFKSVNDNI